MQQAKRTRSATTTSMLRPPVPAPTLLLLCFSTRLTRFCLTLAPSCQDPKDRDRVDREARVMRHLSNHACIIRLFEAVETPGFVYLAMEHCTKG